jgi:hypothetical protein
MKNRWNLPLNQKETARLYWELSRRGAFCNGEKYDWKYKRLHEEELLTLAVLQARYDPRLAAILVDFLRSEGARFHPVRLKETLRKREALPVMAALGEFVLETSPPLPVREMMRFLITGASPVPIQLFYRGLYPIGGKKMEEAASKPLWGFKKWGFLAADPPLLKERLPAKRPYLFDQASRLQILRELTRKKSRFRLRDYLQEIGFSVSRQQALKDLRAIPWIRKKGERKGALYMAGE